MASRRNSTQTIRRFLIEMVAEHPKDVVAHAATRFGLSRQAIHQHLQKLVAEGAVTSKGVTRKKVYGLAILRRWRHSYSLAGLGEDRVWVEGIQPQLGSLRENVLDMWHYGCSEMVNNAIDHSAGSTVVVEVEQDALCTTIRVLDDGIGIFKKIRAAFGLADERHAVLELAKGKVTTDPSRHTGEGIFFASRMFDAYAILAGDVYFSHSFPKPEDWIVDTTRPHRGTLVEMRLANDSARTTKSVFDKFSEGEDYAFSKTVVPVRLMRYGDDNLVSRSQAKRLLAGLAKFKVVVLDFEEVAKIGQAFADEVFRVFPSQHAGTQLLHVNSNADVKRMITRALGVARDT